jgi:hypothetical protein
LVNGHEIRNIQPKNQEKTTGLLKYLSLCSLPRVSQLSWKAPLPLQLALLLLLPLLKPPHSVRPVRFLRLVQKLFSGVEVS